MTQELFGLALIAVAFVGIVLFRDWSRRCHENTLEIIRQLHEPQWKCEVPSASADSQPTNAAAPEQEAK